MHESVKTFVEATRRYFPKAFEDKDVLEVGSRFINGTVRMNFTRCRYIGLDLTPGTLVDKVCHVADYQGPQVDTLISCEALEHDIRWAESLRAMVALVKPGGLLIITCAAPPRAEHGTKRTNPFDSPATTEYYGNIDASLFWSVMDPQDFVAHDFGVGSGDLHFWGVKRL